MDYLRRLDTDFVLKPFNPQVHKISNTNYYYPQTELHILTTRSSERFDPLIIKNAKITAKFGFSAIPEAISQATLIQALRFFKRKDTPFNVFGNEQTGQIELLNKIDPDAMQLIKGYIKHKL
jgi:response regulator of citrate/malate metabolism